MAFQELVRVRIGRQHVNVSRAFATKRELSEVDESTHNADGSVRRPSRASGRPARPRTSVAKKAAARKTVAKKAAPKKAAGSTSDSAPAKKEND